MRTNKAGNSRRNMPKAKRVAFVALSATTQLAHFAEAACGAGCVGSNNATCITGNTPDWKTLYDNEKVFTLCTAAAAAPALVAAYESVAGGVLASNFAHILMDTGDQSLPEKFEATRQGEQIFVPYENSENENSRGHQCGELHGEAAEDHEAFLAHTCFVLTDYWQKQERYLQQYSFVRETLDATQLEVVHEQTGAVIDNAILNGIDGLDSLEALQDLIGDTIVPVMDAWLKTSNATKKYDGTSYCGSQCGDGTAEVSLAQCMEQISRLRRCTAIDGVKIGFIGAKEEQKQCGYTADHTPAPADTCQADTLKWSEHVNHRQAVVDRYTPGSLASNVEQQVVGKFTDDCPAFCACTAEQEASCAAGPSGPFYEGCSTVDGACQYRACDAEADCNKAHGGLCAGDPAQPFCHYPCSESCDQPGTECVVVGPDADGFATCDGICGECKCTGQAAASCTADHSSNVFFNKDVPCVVANFAASCNVAQCDESTVSQFCTDALEPFCSDSTATGCDYRCTSTCKTDGTMACNIGTDGEWSCSCSASSITGCQNVNAIFYESCELQTDATGGYVGTECKYRDCESTNFCNEPDDYGITIYGAYCDPTSPTGCSYECTDQCFSNGTGEYSCDDEPITDSYMDGSSMIGPTTGQDIVIAADGFCAYCQPDGNCTCRPVFEAACNDTTNATSQFFTDQCNADFECLYTPCDTYRDCTINGANGGGRCANEVGSGLEYCKYPCNPPGSEACDGTMHCDDPFVGDSCQCSSSRSQACYDARPRFYKSCDPIGSEADGYTGTECVYEECSNAKCANYDANNDWRSQPVHGAVCTKVNNVPINVGPTSDDVPTCGYNCGETCDGIDAVCRPNEMVSGTFNCDCDDACYAHPFFKSCDKSNGNAVCVYEYVGADCEKYCGEGKTCTATASGHNDLPTCVCDDGSFGPNCDNFGGLRLSLSEDQDPSRAAYAGTITSLKIALNDVPSKPTVNFDFGATSVINPAPTAEDLNANRDADMRARASHITGYVIEGKSWMTSLCDRGFVRVYGMGKPLAKKTGAELAALGGILVPHGNEERVCSYESATTQTQPNFGYFYDVYRAENDRCYLFPIDLWDSLEIEDETDFFASSHYGYETPETREQNPGVCAKTYLHSEHDPKIRYTMFKGKHNALDKEMRLALQYLQHDGSGEIKADVSIVVSDGSGIFTASKPERVRALGPVVDKHQPPSVDCKQTGDILENFEINNNIRKMQCVLPARWSGEEYRYKVYGTDGAEVANEAAIATQEWTDLTTDITWGNSSYQMATQVTERTFTFTVTVGPNPTSDPFYVDGTGVDSRFEYLVTFKADGQRGPRITCGCSCNSHGCREEVATGFLEVSHDTFGLEGPYESWWKAGGADEYNGDYTEIETKDEDTKIDDISEYGVDLTLEMPTSAGGDYVAGDLVAQEFSENPGSIVAKLQGGDYDLRDVDDSVSIWANDTSPETNKVRMNLPHTLPALVVIEAKAAGAFSLPDPWQVTFKRCLGSPIKADLESDYFGSVNAGGRIVEIFDSANCPTDPAITARYGLDGRSAPTMDRLALLIRKHGESNSFLKETSVNGWQIGFVRCLLEVTYTERYCDATGRRLTKKSLLTKMFRDRNLAAGSMRKTNTGSPIVPFRFWAASATVGEDGKSLMGAGKLGFGDLSAADLLDLSSNTALMGESIKEHLCSGTDTSCMESVQVVVTGSSITESDGRVLRSIVGLRALQSSSAKLEVQFQIFFVGSSDSSAAAASLQKQVQMSTLKFLGSSSLPTAFVQKLSENLSAAGVSASALKKVAAATVETVDVIVNQVVSAPIPSTPDSLLRPDSVEDATDENSEATALSGDAAVAPKEGEPEEAVNAAGSSSSMVLLLCGLLGSGAIMLAINAYKKPKKSKRKAAGKKYQNSERDMESDMESTATDFPERESETMSVEKPGTPSSTEPVQEDSSEEDVAERLAVQVVSKKTTAKQVESEEEDPKVLIASRSLESSTSSAEDSSDENLETTSGKEVAY